MDVKLETHDYKVASAFNAAFQTFKRDATGDELFLKLRDKVPQWMHDAVQSAHGDLFPDDWVYSKCAEVVNRIASELHSGDLEDVRDNQAEIVDGLVDIFNSELTAWLASNVYRIGYCDEATEEYGPLENGEVIPIIRNGQYYEIDQIFTAILSAIETQSNEAVR